MASKNTDSLGWIFFPFALVWEWRKRMGFVGPLTILGVLALLSFGFHHYTVPRLASWPEYQLISERWEVTQKPTWIRGDVIREAIENGDLTKLSLLDPKLAEKANSAFVTSAWVKEVNRIEKRYPAKVRVDVTYRKPVAVVEVVDEASAEEGLACYFVDEYGVLLPQSDFSEVDLTHYPRIRVPGATRQGPKGAPWGDPRVEQAASIAGAILDKFNDWGIYSIELATRGDEDFRGKGPFMFRLSTVRGLKVDFGRAPGLEDSAEPTVGEKVRRLTHYVLENGKLSDLDPAVVIDVRPTDRIIPKPAFGESDN